jgi:hypothetical protein
MRPLLLRAALKNGCRAFASECSFAITIYSHTEQIQLMENDWQLADLIWFSRQSMGDLIVRIGLIVPAA